MQERRAETSRVGEPVQEIVAAPASRGFRGWSAVGYRSSGQAPGLHRGLPSAYLTFIVSLDGPLVVGQSAAELGTDAAGRHHVLVAGLHHRPAFVAQPAQQCGVQLAVHPLAARAVFGAPARELAGQVSDGDDVLGASVLRLRERLAEVASWPDRFALVEAYLRSRVERAAELGAVRPEVAAAWTWLARHRGAGSMTGAAAHVSLSPRQLSTLFHREVGAGPKQVSRLMRFGYARRLLARAALAGPDLDLDLADIAVRAGFYDHSHLVRDFQQYSGLSPTGWLAEERGNIQASGHQGAAG